MTELFKWVTSDGLDGSLFGMKRIHVAWKIGDEAGHGLPHSPDQRKQLEDWCDEGNKNYGPGTHWIEEIEV